MFSSHFLSFCIRYESPFLNLKSVPRMPRSKNSSKPLAAHIQRSERPSKLFSWTSRIRRHHVHLVVLGIFDSRPLRLLPLLSFHTNNHPHKMTSLKAHGPCYVAMLSRNTLCYGRRFCVICWTTLSDALSERNYSDVLWSMESTQ